MAILTVRHLTTYRYRQPVSFGEHRMMFRPRDGQDQRLIEATLAIAPTPVGIRWLHDVFGNCVGIARFAGRARELRFDSTVRLEHRFDSLLEFQLLDYARTYPFTYGADEMPDLLRLIERDAPDPEREVDGWARQFLVHGGGPTSTRELLTAITMAIKRDFTYVAREEQGVQEAVRTLKLGSGSCRDFALLMMEAVRSLGLAARFVSGYLYTPTESGHVGGGATHAWVQVYLPGAGWVEFDPTNGIVGNRDLIRVAVARAPSQAVPLSGTWTGFPTDFIDMTVNVTVSAAAPEESTEPTPLRRA